MKRAIQIQDDWPDWKKELAEQAMFLGKSMKAVSLEAGFNETYFRDILKRDQTPTFEKMQRLREVLQLDSNLTKTTKNPPKSRDSTLAETNASSLAYADLAARKGIPVVGTVAAGSLTEVATMNDERPEEYRIVPGVHTERFPAEWQYAMDVEGDSMNLYAPSGSLVVCVDVVASGIEVVSGMRVHVQHFRFGGQVVEQTLKTVHLEKGKMVLVPESTNPRWKPIIFNGSDYDNGDEFDQVVIKGVVVRKMTDEAL